MKFERVILHYLIENEEYLRKIIPFLKKEWFLNENEKKLFQIIYKHYLKYDKIINYKTILIEYSTDIEDEEKIKEFKNFLNKIKKIKIEESFDWLINKTEEYIKKIALEEAIIKSVDLIKSKKNTSSIVKIIEDAIKIKIDDRIGLDLFEDAEEIYDRLIEEKLKIPFNKSIYNKATMGGVERKTLNVILAGTGVGKSLFLCDLSADYIRRGYNVLYFTFEMAEEKISARIDANLFDVDLNYLTEIPKQTFLKRIKSLLTQIQGRLIVKEFPSASVNTLHLQNVIENLKRKNFFPDIVIVDYLNLLLPIRINNSNNTYINTKFISEELRGLAQKFDFVIWTASQINREGYKSVYFDLDKIAEGFGINHTSDLVWGIVQNEEMEELGVYLINQLKSRYADKSKLPHFKVAVNKSKMKIFEIENNMEGSE